MYSSLDESRRFDESQVPSSLDDASAYRNEFRRDYGRVLHSSSFRRLSNKTQLFPDYDSDFFRNRLTHSLEVAQIAKTIASKLNHDYSQLDISLDVVEFAALAHDIGHPPFGHLGEHALDQLMKKHGGFEGNAQTLRIIARLEKKIKDTESYTGFDKQGMDLRYGLNPTLRSIASIIKYDKIIKYDDDQRKHPTKGYYKVDHEIVKEIKEKLLDNPEQQLYTIECSIMDIADDIAYSVYDLEDALKGGFLHPLELIGDKNLIKSVTTKVNEKLKPNAKEAHKYNTGHVLDVIYGVFKQIGDRVIADRNYPKESDMPEDKAWLPLLADAGKVYNFSNELIQSGYQRTKFTSSLIGYLIRSVSVKIEPALGKDSLILARATMKDEDRLLIEVFKRLTYELQIDSAKMKMTESRGEQIVKGIFTKIRDSKGGLLPPDFKAIYDIYSGFNNHSTDSGQMRTICDFIAGMTDHYASGFYERLHSSARQSIYHPQ